MKKIHWINVAKYECRVHSHLLGYLIYRGMVEFTNHIVSIKQHVNTRKFYSFTFTDRIANLCDETRGE